MWGILVGLLVGKPLGVHAGREVRRPQSGVADRPEGTTTVSCWVPATPPASASRSRSSSPSWRSTRRDRTRRCRRQDGHPPRLVGQRPVGLRRAPSRRASSVAATSRQPHNSHRCAHQLVIETCAQSPRPAVRSDSIRPRLHDGRSLARVTDEALVDVQQRLLLLLRQQQGRRRWPRARRVRTSRRPGSRLVRTASRR